jgi:hypothetical protein
VNVGIFKSSGVILSLFLILGIFLGGCMDLAGDVLPPQDMGSRETAPSTPFPTLTDTPDETRIQDEVDSEQLAGTVYVEIIDHSGGVVSTQDIDVRLEGYDEFEKSFERILELPGEGPAVFYDVPLISGRVYFASIAYSGAVYRSAIHQVGPETREIVLQVSIFETTTDTAGITIDRIHVLIDYPGPESIQISEILILSNLGDKTVVAGDPGRPVLTFPLPEGASDIQFENGAFGQRYIETEDGFGDTVSIPPGPGVYQVLVYYRLPFRGSKLDYSQTMNYPVSAVVAMTPAGLLKIKGNFFQDLGMQSLPNGDVQVYSGDEIAKGDNLEFRITGIKASAVEKPFTDILDLNPYFIVVGILGFGLVLAGIVLLIRNQKPGSVDKEAVIRDDEKNQILDSIIALEDLYNEGEISKDDFQRKRQELKDKLKDLV